MSGLSAVLCCLSAEDAEQQGGAIWTLSGIVLTETSKGTFTGVKSLTQC